MISLRSDFFITYIQKGVSNAALALYPTASALCLRLGTFGKVDKTMVDYLLRAVEATETHWQELIDVRLVEVDGDGWVLPRFVYEQAEFLVPSVGRGAATGATESEG